MKGYQLIDNRQFDWPVTVHIPNRDGGSDKFSFTATFVARSPEDMADSIDAAQSPRAIKADMLGQILVGWNGLQDQDGAPLEFTKDNIAAVARDMFLTNAILTAYRGATSAEMQRKN